MKKEIAILELVAKQLNEAWESNAEKMKYMNAEDEETQRLFSVNSKIEDSRVRVLNVIYSLSKEQEGEGEECTHPNDMRHGSGYLESEVCIKCGKHL